MCVDTDVDIDIDMAVSIHWGIFKMFRAPLQAFGVHIRQV